MAATLFVVEAKVCAWTDKIVGVKTPNMVVSGFQISPDLIVTNRHVAEDHLRVLVRNAEGKVNPYHYRMIFQQTWSFFAQRIASQI